MKRKYLSLVCSILSIVIAVTFVVLAVVLIFRMANGIEYTPPEQEGIWLVEVFARIKQAGFTVFFTILGILLAVILVVYRSMLAYFYLKLFTSDEKFYRARLGENIFFAIAAGIAIIVFGVLAFGAKSAIAPELIPLIIIFMVLYCIAFALPLTEIAIVYITKAFAKAKPVVSAPTKDDILDELDELADKTATDMVEEKSQTEE